jgi:hypothetical protein
VRGTAARTVIRGRVAGREVVTEPGTLPGAPPDGGAIDTVAVVDPPITTERGNYITTPPRCPKDRTWTMRVEFTYDGGETQLVANDTPCRKDAGR